MGYTKLFSEIVASTIWREDDKTRLVWITMLAMKDERHIVAASVPGLADLARVTLKDTEAALKKLLGPDKYSRNQNNAGRRIEVCAGGWRILNGEYYRQKMSLEERREYQKVYHRAYRKTKKDLGTAAYVDGATKGIADGFREDEQRWQNKTAGAKPERQPPIA